MKNKVSNCTNYSRSNPSSEYSRLLGLYKDLHTNGNILQNDPPEKVFPGKLSKKHVENIKTLIEKYSAESILDYGCGKALPYKSEKICFSNGETIPPLKEYWGIKKIGLYDPALSAYKELPSEKFDGVICTDVLEHCPEHDIEWIIDEILSFAKKFAYFYIAGHPAINHLPTGENAHVTIKKLSWWKGQIDQCAQKYPYLEIELKYSDRIKIRQRINIFLTSIMLGIKKKYIKLHRKKIID